MIEQEAIYPLIDHLPLPALYRCQYYLAKGHGFNDHVWQVIDDAGYNDHMGAAQFIADGRWFYFPMKNQFLFFYIFFIFLLQQLPNGELFGVINDIGTPDNMQWIRKSAIP